MTQTQTLDQELQQLTKTYHTLASTLHTSRLAFAEAVSGGDRVAASLASEQLSLSLQAFREAEKAVMTELPDGRRIFVADYVGLKQLAEDNELDIYYVLWGIEQDSATFRVEGLLLEGKGISNIQGLSTLSGLNRLTLRDNQISDITPLTNLTGLTELDLEFNQISDLAPLAHLSRLSSLYLLGNQITDLTPLRDLVGLEMLVLARNPIEDITPLKNLTGLRTVWLDPNHLSARPTLAKLTEAVKRLLGNKKDTTIQALKDAGCEVYTCP
jgi:hypothetical protein